ncbi:hypothetical protein IQ07DRAFT_581582 [Pyrenochaeta sp. DS3sAY3a]|nr:hypothetical protein IQ07DRAFT_581582 [Pyrenochaeta sp. DS3sAY3a]
MARAVATAARRSVPKRTRRGQQAGGMSAPSTRSTTSSRVLRSHTAKAEAALKASKVTKPKPRRRADPWTPKRKAKTTSTPRARAPPATHYSCRICIEEQPIDQFVRWVPPKTRRFSIILDIPFNCIAHLSRNPRRKNVDPVCKTCIGNSMSARLDTLGAREVGTGCLEPGCKETWHHDFIMRYMPRGEPLEKFNMEMFNVWMEDATPKPIKCISPTCSAIGLPDITAPGFPQVTCHECAVRSCAQCHVPWHKDLTCAEYSAQHVNEQMSDLEKDTLKLMQTKDGKRCPNCQLVIEKDGGCDSMYCIGCHKYFNWASAASAVPGAKKAQPIIHDAPYWVNPTVGTCEADDLAKNPTPNQMVAAAA